MYLVYLIISEKNNRIKSCVGYTNDLKKRINDHNNSKGAKSTRGRYWQIAFKKKFKTKSSAMKYEYFLKKNKRLRNKIKDNYVV